MSNKDTHTHTIAILHWIKCVIIRYHTDPESCLQNKSNLQYLSPHVAVDSGQESVKIVRFLRVQFPHYPG